MINRVDTEEVYLPLSRSYHEKTVFITLITLFPSYKVIDFKITKCISLVYKLGILLIRHTISEMDELIRSGMMSRVSRRSL